MTPPVVFQVPATEAKGAVPAPVMMPPVMLRAVVLFAEAMDCVAVKALAASVALPLAVPVNAPTKVVLVTLVRPVMVAGKDRVGVVVPVTVIWFAVPVMLVTPPVTVAQVPSPRR